MNKFDTMLASVKAALTNLKTELVAVSGSNSQTATEIVDGTPYYTGQSQNGRRIMGFRFAIPALGNNAPISVALPVEVTSKYDDASEIWINTGQSYVYSVADNLTVPLINTAKTYWSDQIEAKLDTGALIVGVSKNMTTYKANITINYLEKTT